MVTRVLSYTLPSAAPIKMGVSRDNGLTPLDPVSVGFLLPCSIRINKPAPIDQVRISRPTIELQGAMQSHWPAISGGRKEEYCVINLHYGTFSSFGRIGRAFN